MVKILLFNYFSYIMSSFIFFIIINIITVNGAFLQKRLFQRSYEECSMCKSYFNEVLKEIPDDIDKNSGLKYFAEVLKVIFVYLKK